MLSTLSSFLPSALSEKLEKLDPMHDSPVDRGQTDDEGVKRKDMVDDAGKKEKKKKMASNETFIVVRPPPAKSNHPLNLQLQLVPAHNSRERSNTSNAATPSATTPTGSRFSAEFARGSEAVPQAPPSPAASEHEQSRGVKRSSSVRSNRSDASPFYASSSVASTGSVTSFASTASNASGRRMIIPLYNLHAHNVMTNTILDAGTDAKVAKFLKRGLEIMGLAILEPTECWNGPANGTSYDDVPIQRSTSGTSSLAPPGQNVSRGGTPEPPHSPGSSRLSLSSGHSSVSHVSANDHITTPTSPPPSSGAKKLFGKMFRRKDGGHTPTSSVTAIPPTSPIPPSPLPEPRTPMTPKSTTPTAGKRTTEALAPAVLGLTPALSAAAYPPTGRCVSYIWVVRKWLKTDNQSLISGVLGKMGREASMGMADTAEWEVRFEWSRGKSKAEKTRKATRRASLDVGAKRSRTPSRRNSALIGLEDMPEGQQTSDGVAISIDSPRQSLDVVHERPTRRTPSPRRQGATNAASISSHTPSEEEGALAGMAVEDAGDESDPEDSETPWTCSLILTHPSRPVTSTAFVKGHSRTRTISSTGPVTPNDPTTPTPNNAITASDGGPGAVKLKVATLAPAPHHPKVVCQLKIPFPLPDVEVDRGVLRKRVVLGDGSTRSTVPREHHGPAPLIMTAEEIKDVVCSTAFWVVVREGFGGLGKVSRKGDGWKIRG